MSKNKIFNFIIILLLIVIAITIIMIIIKYGRNQVNEKHLSAVVDEFETKYNNDEKISEDIMIDDYKVIGIITIPKINLKYPILDRTDNKGMKLSITKFWGSELNEVGNVTLAGHNNRDGTMFGKTKNLEKGDIIKVTDMKNRTLDYEVFDYYIIDPNDVSCVESIDGSTKEVTLITCSNGNKKRLVTKAREIKNNQE